MLIQSGSAIELVRISDIIRKDRQRKDLGDVEGLAASITRINLLHPIVITRDLKLVAGERRLEAHLLLNRTHIEARYVDGLTPNERRLIELEENTRRKDFDWKEESNAYADYHFAATMNDPEWSIEDTARELNRDATQIYRRLEVARNINDPLIKDCTSLREAYNVLARRAVHSMDNEVAEILDSGGASLNERVEILEGNVIVSDDPGEIKPLKVTTEEIFQADFFEWAKTYTGQPFNFLHLDPPYGVEHQDSDQGGSHKYEKYDDSEEVYWRFLDTIFKNADRLLSSKSHIMLWYTMGLYTPTMNRFAKELATRDIRLNDFPLIWFKSDNSGIVPDHMRGPRRVYETALMFSLGDRKTFTPVANLFPYPLNRSRRHVSEKPMPMLHHFFRMFVDPHTRFLDPCCGAGSSLVAADLLGAESITGFDLNLANVDLSRSGLLLSRSGATNALSSLDAE